MILLFGAMPLTAQSPTTSELLLGLSLQPDATQDYASGGQRFTLLPIGPTVGAAVRHRLSGSSTIGVRLAGSYFIVGAQKSIPFGEPPAPAENLALIAAAIEVGSAKWKAAPVTLGAGVVHAVSEPRLAPSTSAMVSAGVSRRVSSKLDARAWMDLCLKPIGRSWFQLPVVLSFHPAEAASR